ncbi:MAG: tRNA A-37 threonylcarbamoyl transferase component Bud32 [Candidatus Paceibacteria bacterium]|jgi:tRNA A-37 threonylcarbamoyl transferase component Bud32
MAVSLPILHELPSGYFVDESPQGILALHVAVARAIHGTGYGPEHDGELCQSELSGRRPLFELEAEGERFVVRRFSHGGLMRWVTGERYLNPERPFRELILSDTLRRAGIATPQVVAARARPASGGGWYLDLVSRRIDGTTDLGFLLGQARLGKLQVGPKRALLRALGALVRQMHRHGFLHADLTPTNVLVNSGVVDGEEPELWVIDLDQSEVKKKPSRMEVSRNLRRLFRYVSRREGDTGRGMSRTDYARFMSAYEPERERRRDILRSVHTAHRRRRLYHGLGWFFERVFRQRVDPREAL